MRKTGEKPLAGRRECWRHGQKKRPRQKWPSGLAASRTSRSMLIVARLGATIHFHLLGYIREISMSRQAT
jgi:hypothetical protein